LGKEKPVNIIAEFPLFLFLLTPTFIVQFEDRLQNMGMDSTPTCIYFTSSSLFLNAKEKQAMHDLWITVPVFGWLTV
jgi:hypothetical protein